MLLGEIESVAIHQVGNKILEDNILISESPLELDETLRNDLQTYFSSSFNSEEYFHLYHDNGLEFNVVYGLVSRIFEEKDSLFEQSVELARYLYEKSVHPKIKGGEFYTVYFKGCSINGENADAVGLFKSENKDTFLKVFPTGHNLEMTSEKGINIRKLDKGCIIFDTEEEDGYLVAIVDNTNKGAEAQYWIDDFLHVRQRQDDYFNTQNILSAYKSFITKELPEQFEVSKADQSDLLNKSMKFFKEKESFDMEKFGNEVIESPEVIDSFHRFADRYQQDNQIELPEQFDISSAAVRKQARSYKSVIKLDKNFHIYVHGNRNLIEQGEDEKGKFYKVYYKEES